MISLRQGLCTWHCLVSGEYSENGTGMYFQDKSFICNSCWREADDFKRKKKSILIMMARMDQLLLLPSLKHSLVHNTLVPMEMHGIGHQFYNLIQGTYHFEKAKKKSPFMITSIDQVLNDIVNSRLVIPSGAFDSSWLNLKSKTNNRKILKKLAVKLYYNVKNRYDFLRSFLPDDDFDPSDYDEYDADHCNGPYYLLQCLHQTSIIFPPCSHDNAKWCF
ncbi:hypothetical protein BDA99DRAFT_544401 [Phascolomyces articulosus]|uniref:Uncharacterized protein n=1 Tax=Phascolomyces articulosus TaxID=60185 RepID=A0AAD5JKC7_9FUNG|nr:hypothetical protein BDA99DRAFT_544401 [Phascolomyces articulosus]